MSIDEISRAGLPVKQTKKERIAELETLLGVLERSAERDLKQKRLIVLLDEPGKGLSVVLDKKANDYTIDSRNDYAVSYPNPLLTGGTITIRWH